MGPEQLWVTVVTIVIALSVVGPSSYGVRAAQAVCRSGWDWNKNSLGQDPCLIVAYLESACRSDPEYVLRTLKVPNDNYLRPQPDDGYDLTCDCNTVTYSLYMACTTCQGGILISWPVWRYFCTSVSVAQYPHDIPDRSAFPRWAFFDITTLTDQTYSDNVAMSIGRNPEATPRSPSTTSTTSVTSTSSPSSVSYPTPTNNSSTPYPTHTNNIPGNGNTTTTSNTNNTGVIIGGVVGGVAPMIILAVVIVLYFQRRRHATPLPDPRSTQEYYPSGSPAPTTIRTGPPQSPYLSPGPGQYNGMPEI